MIYFSGLLFLTSGPSPNKEGHWHCLYMAFGEVSAAIWMLFLGYVMPNELLGIYRYLLLQNFNYGVRRLLQHIQNRSVKQLSYDLAYFHTIRACLDRKPEKEKNSLMETTQYSTLSLQGFLYPGTKFLPFSNYPVLFSCPNCKFEFSHLRNTFDF